MASNTVTIQNNLVDYLNNCVIYNISFDNTNCNIYELEPRPFVPSLAVQIIWTILFSTMVLFASLGNLAVISVIVGKRALRTKINIYLLNLSIADFLMATINTMFNFIYFIKSHWPFGIIWCKVNNFVANLAIAASVFTITVTTFDRYYAVMYPLDRRSRKKKQSFIVFLIWLLSAVIALPPLIFGTTYTYHFVEDEHRTLCFIAWPDGFYSFLSIYDFIYTIIFFLVTYAIPLTAMFFTYRKMLPVLRSQAIGESVCSDSQKEAIRSKRKAVDMLFSLALVFAIVWLPYHLYFIYVFFRPFDTKLPFVQHLFLSFYLLAMSNSLLNVIIYFLMNKRFRTSLTEFFCCFQRSQPIQQYTSRADRTNYNATDNAGSLGL